MIRFPAKAMTSSSPITMYILALDAIKFGYSEADERF